MSYAVKEAFLTLQGEGAHAGSRAVFVRFSGCNVWSGREQDRSRDTKKGVCAAWCDTNFFGTDGVNGGRYTADELVAKVRELWGPGRDGIVVLTGGEPSLQVDEALVRALHDAYFRIHIETNGSNRIVPGVDWITLSPKPPMPVVVQRYDEVKVVVPAVDPHIYESYAPLRFVQALDDGTREPMKQAIDYVMAHPCWRLSVQTHKTIGVP